MVLRTCSDASEYVLLAHLSTRSHFADVDTLSTERVARGNSMRSTEHLCTPVAPSRLTDLPGFSLPKRVQYRFPGRRTPLCFSLALLLCSLLFRRFLLPLSLRLPFPLTLCCLLLLRGFLLRGLLLRSLLLLHH